MTCLRAVVYILRRISVEFQFHLCGRIQLHRTVRRNWKRKIKSTCVTLSKRGTLWSATRDKSRKWYLAKCAVVSIYINIYIFIYICVYVYKHLLYITAKMRYIPVTVTLQFANRRTIWAIIPYDPQIIYQCSAVLYYSSSYLSIAPFSILNTKIWI